MKKTKEEKQKAKINANVNETVMAFVSKVHELQEKDVHYEMSIELTRTSPWISSEVGDWVIESEGPTTMTITLIYP